MTLANALALKLLAAFCSSSAPRLVPLALLLLATRCEAAGTLCDNNLWCSSGCPTVVYGTSLCDGTYNGTGVSLWGDGLSGTIPPQLGDISQLQYLDLRETSISGTVPARLGDIWQLGYLNLRENSISGTIPAQLGDISGLRGLYLDDNSISGTIPARLGDISQLGYLDLGSNSISGTVPSDTGKLSSLNQLYLHDNRLSGTIPAQLGDISGLDWLYLNNNYLTGTLPRELAKLASLALLDVRNNRLAYPRGSKAHIEYICRDVLPECRGVPPDSCSAFADAKLSMTEPNKCVVCDKVTAGLVLVGVCILIGIVALAAFVRFVVRHPAALKRWVSTAAILFNHAQTASVIASMRLEWPRSLVAIASALKLHLFMLPSASCFVGGEDSPFDTYAIYASSVMLLLLLAPILVRHAALCHRRLDIADTAELVLSLIYSLLFTFGWSLVLKDVAYAAENALESCLYSATALFLAFAMVYTALPADPVALRVSVEALMATVLLGSLIVGAVFSIRQLRRMRRALARVDLSAILSAADSNIDGSIADRLRDGSVQLLRCSWLASPASDAFLGRDASGAVIMKRQQDMPPEAFVPCDEAVAMLERGDRSVLALSYGWLTALHPDPHGTTLAAVRRYIAADEAAGDTGLFWDFASLPQKGLNGEDKTEEEKAIFGRGLKVMGNFYASVTGTSVIQQRGIDLPPGATTGFGPGEYNPTPYEGEGGRGWCIFEQGTAMTVLAHLTAAERQAAEEGKALPERFRRAQASRAKVYDIGGEAPVARECSLPPKQVLDEACRAIEKARFTDKADKVMVPQMLAEFEWIFRSTFEEALGDHATSGATLPPSASWAVGSIELASELGLHSSGHV